MSCLQLLTGLGILFWTQLVVGNDPAPNLPEVPVALRDFVKVTWDGPSLDPMTPTLQLTLQGVRVTNSVCLDLLKFKKVGSVDAYQVKLITDEQVRILSQFPDLRWFRATGKEVTDDCALSLSQSTALEMIQLSHTDISDVGVGRLSTLKNLRILDLRGTFVLGSESTGKRCQEPFNGHCSVFGS